MEDFTKNEINARIAKVLKDMGVKEPPIDLEDVLAHLSIYRNYYDLTEPGLINEIKHKLRIGAKKLIDLTHKISLKGLCIPSESKIFIDSSVKPAKQKWIEAHEICHKIIPWHAEFLHGDTEETLDPEFHELIESEANYAASELIFLGGQFKAEALDLKNDFSTVTELSKRYKNSTTATLRRYVEHSYDSPMIGLVHTPYWLDKPEDQITRCRHYIKSPLFSGKFSNVQSNYLINEVERINYKARGGPVGEGEFSLLDDNGQLHTFNSFSFFNSYYILTLIKYRQHSIQII